jgi:hypothetical protein
MAPLLAVSSGPLAPGAQELLEPRATATRYSPITQQGSYQGRQWVQRRPPAQLGGAGLPSNADHMHGRDPEDVVRTMYREVARYLFALDDKLFAIR